MDMNLPLNAAGPTRSYTPHQPSSPVYNTSHSLSTQMISDFPTYALILVLPVLAMGYVVRAAKQRDPQTLPPGPRGVPIFGNLFQLSMAPWKNFEAWRKQYGPVIYITVAGRGILVLNTLEAASALLDRKGTNYAERPRCIIFSEIFCRGLFLPLMSASNDLFRRMRRAAHEALSKARVTEYGPMQERGAVILVDEMLRHPEKWENQLLRASLFNILTFLYDMPEDQATSDDTMKLAHEFMSKVVQTGVGMRSLLVDFFPWLLHTPLFGMAKLRKDVEECHRKYTQMLADNLQEVKDRIDQGEESPSFSGTLIRDKQRHHLDDLESVWLHGSLYVAGLETVTTAMIWFTLAMIAFPEKQRKCQEELDAVVGRSRTPTLQDKVDLPYIQATVRETLRWRAVTPLIVPHCTKEDDSYNGFFIPKGTICLANIWAINRDRDVYGDDADNFNPDRFIDADGKLSSALANTRDEGNWFAANLFSESDSLLFIIRHIGHVAYGHCSRICVGRHVASNSLFINIACLLWAVNITPVNDETGWPIIPDTLETPSAALAVRPLPFECLITPRFPEATTIIAQMRGSS
ncbi:hypothetical protein AX17_004119 [Amanita inopinata Kibby_2008]|nr:hypothetical protein AX17_004119 [Amanita inopinata Kibby_2008]